MYPGGDMLRVNHELSIAITKALTILGYFELPEDESPDESIWNHPEKLDEWWEQVKSARDEKYGNTSKNESWEDVDMDENEYSKEIKEQYGIK